MTAFRAEVSVVVATRDRADRIERLLAALEGQDPGGPLEVVVVDDCSHDDTPARLRRWAAADPAARRFIRLDRHMGPAAARNRGWLAASAPLVAFTDDDCVPSARWLAKLAEVDADVIQGKTLPDPAQRINDGPFSRTMRVESESGFYQTCNIAYRRDVLDRLGGFDEQFRHPAGEDTDLAWRARKVGARTAFAPEALVLHDVRPSSFLVHLRDLPRWEGTVLLCKRHPELRSTLFEGPFWRTSHRPTVLAIAGVALALGSRRRAAAAIALASVVPYVRFRTTEQPLAEGARRWLLVGPALVADAVEVGVIVRAAARYRTFLL